MHDLRATVVKTLEHVEERQVESDDLFNQSTAVLIRYGGVLDHVTALNRPDDNRSEARLLDLVTKRRDVLSGGVVVWEHQLRNEDVR